MWNNKFLDFVLESVPLMCHEIKVIFYPGSYHLPKIFTAIPQTQFQQR